MTLADPTHFRVEGVPPAQDAAFRQAADEVQANFDRSTGTNGSYTFTHEAEHRSHSCARSRSCRRGRRSSAASTSSASPSRASRSRAQRSDSGAAARRHRRRSRQGDHRIARPARAEDRRAGTGRDAGKTLLRQRRRRAGGHGSAAGRRSTPATGGGTSYYLVRRVAAVTGQDLRNARATARREQPARGRLHAERRGRPQFGA